MKPEIISRFPVGMFKAGGLSDEEIDAIEGVYSARHILPTFAEVANLNPSDRLDVGGWSSRAAAQDTAMPNLYSAARLWKMASIKERVIEGIEHAHAAYSKLPEYRADLVWESIFHLWPPASDAALAFSPCAAAVEGPVHKDSDKATIPLPEVRSDTDSAESYTSDASSGSSGMFLDEKSERVAQSIQWQLSTGRSGHLHYLVDGALACGRKLSRPESGQSLQSALSCNRPWSPTCRARLPDLAREWLDASER